MKRVVLLVALAFALTSSGCVITTYGPLPPHAAPLVASPRAATPAQTLERRHYHHRHAAAVRPGHQRVVPRPDVGQATRRRPAIRPPNSSRRAPGPGRARPTHRGVPGPRPLRPRASGPRPRAGSPAARHPQPRPLPPHRSQAAGRRPSRPLPPHRSQAAPRRPSRPLPPHRSQAAPRRPSRPLPHRAPAKPSHQRGKQVKHPTKVKAKPPNPLKRKGNPHANPRGKSGKAGDKRRPVAKPPGT